MSRRTTHVNLHSLDPESWSRIDSILDQVLELPPDQLSSAIARFCAGDLLLEEQVRAIVAADLTVQGYLGAAARHAMIEQVAGGGERVDTSLRDANQSHSPGAGSGDLEPVALTDREFGPWRLLRLLGRGGMGAVYLGERADGAFQQRVAIKILRRATTSPELLARFRQERQILARLEHPNIARLVDGGVTEDGTWWFAMEYVDGSPITEWRTSHKPSVRAILERFRQVCGAVQYAHRNLVIHRDLKPSNILVSAGGEVKLVDFGIAKILEPSEEGSGELTLITTAAMTPSYAAPEQVRGEPPTTATDVYALGIVLYELLAGERPYRVKTGSIEEMCRAVLTEDPEPPGARARRLARGSSGADPRVPSASRGREIPNELDAIVLTAIRKEPERRYSSVEALSEDIERHLEGRAVRASGRRFGYLAGKFIRRNRVPVAATLVVLIALFGGLYTTSRARDRAKQEAAKARELKEFALSLFRVSNADVGRGATLTARELLDRGAERVERELRGNPRLQAEMWDLLGSVYRSLDLFPQAIVMFQKAVAARRAHPERPDTLLATSIRNLGSAQYEMGSYAEGERRIREALAIERRVFGPVHPRVALVVGELANLRSRIGSNADAESLYREAIRIDTLTLGWNDYNTASDVANYGMHIYYDGRYRDAEPYIARALAIRRKLLGEVNQETATGMDQMGLALVGMGDVDSGLVYMRQALAIRRRVLPPDHPDIAHSLMNIGSTLHGVGQLEESGRDIREALAIRIRALDPKDPLIAHTHNELGITFYRQRLYDSAAVHFGEALRIWAFSLPAEHQDVLTTRNNLAVIYREMGRYAESERMLREVLALRARFAGRTDLAVTQYHLGRLLVMTGRPGEGLPLLRQADSTRTAAFPADDPRIAEVRLTMGNGLYAVGRVEEGRAMIRQSLENAEIRLGAQDRMVVLGKRRIR